MKIILQSYSQVYVWQGTIAEQITHLKTQVYTKKMHWSYIFKMDIAEMKIHKKTHMVQNKKIALIWRETEYTEILLKAWGSGDKSVQDIMKGRYNVVH